MSYSVIFCRVNPLSRQCDDTGRKSFYFIDSSLNSLRLKARRAFLGLSSWLDFDEDVYCVRIVNLKSKKEHIVV